MKKTLYVALLTLIVILFGSISTMANQDMQLSDDAFFLSTYEQKIVFDEEEASTENRAVIKSNTACSDLFMFAAAYQDGKLIALKRTGLDLTSGSNIINTGIDWSDIDKDQVKLFVWNEDMSPYAEYEYEVLRPAQSKLSLFELTECMPIQYNNSAAYSLTGVYNQQETTVILYNERGYGDTNPGEFVADDLLYISAPDEDGVISYAEKSGAVKYEGVVASTPLSNMVRNGYDPDAQKIMTIADPNNGNFAFECSDIQNIDEYLGKYVKVYVVDNSILSIAEKEGYNSVVSIMSNQLVDSGYRYYDDYGVIGYIEAGSSQISALDLDSKVTVVVNYGAEHVSVTTTKDLAEYFEGYSGKIEFISNDANSRIDVINCIVYSEEAVVEKVSVEEEYIFFDCYTGYIDDFDTEDEGVYAVVIRDGEESSISDIEPGDTVSKLEGMDDSVIIYHVSSEFVEGSVSSYDDTYVGISGKEYRLSACSCYGAPSNLKEVTGKFFINVCGEIAHAEPIREGKYALILAAGTTAGINAGYELEVVLEDGTVAIYPLDSKAYVEYFQTTKDDAETYDYLINNMVEDGDAYRVTTDSITDFVFEVTVKNDKVTKLEKLDSESTASAKKFDEENMTYGVITFGAETVVVSVDAEGTAKVYTDDIVVGRVTDFFADGEGEDASVIAYDEDNNDVAGLVVGFGMVYKGSSTEDEENPEEENIARGLILAAGTTAGINAGYELEVVLEDGTVAIYPLDSKAYVENLQTTKDDAATYNYLINNMVEDGDAYRVTADSITDFVFEVTVKNDKVTKIEKLDSESTASAKKFDEENMIYGAITFGAETVVVSVDAEGTAKVYTDDIVVGRVTDFFVDGEGEDASVIAYDEDNNDVAGLVVGFGIAATVPQDGDALIITNVKTKEIDGDDAFVITGMQAGEEVTYTLYDEDETFDIDDLKKGNIILVAVANAEGIVKDFELLYDVEEGLIAEDDAARDEYYYAGDLDEENTPTDSKFYIVGVEDEIIMRNSANYTLVDYTDSSTNPEVTKKTKGKSIFGSLFKCDSIVFVRYYDDEIKEVVVYRYAQ